MPTLLLDQLVLDQFTRRVVPLLRAKLTRLPASPANALTQLLHDRPRAWALTVHRPTTSAVAKVSFSRHAAPVIFDARVHVENLPEDYRGDMAVRVRAVFGLAAVCDRIDGLEEDRGEPQPHPLLAITCRELTLLADVLPGKDALIAVAVWPNERLPMPLLIRRPDRLSTLAGDVLMVRAIERDRLGFAITCTNCDGTGRAGCLKCGTTGRLDCLKCGTTGRLECRQCDQSGRVECFKCRGSGVFKPQKTCPKCGGSGNFIGRNGHVVGECSACDGRGYWPQRDCDPCSGSGSLSCRGCDGRGERDCHLCGGTGRVPCHPCEGSGQITCAACAGVGYRHARFSAIEGNYSTREQGNSGEPLTRTVDPADVVLFDWTAEAVVPICPGARELFGVVSAAAGGPACDPTREAEVAAHCRRFAGLRGCLDKTLASQGVLECRPIRVGRPEPSTARSSGGVIFEFPVGRNRGEWVRHGLLPFPARTPIRLVHGPDQWEPFPLSYQGKSGPLPHNQGPVLVGCEGEGAELRLKIRFPASVDVAGFPDGLAVKADAPSPPEATQARHLVRWCGRDNRDHPVLRAIATASREAVALPEVQLFDPGIARFPRQIEAVRLGVSDLPLSLIKGPPGTGKTTIITEIVRQLVGRGQRVLVCSQTHQAVRNVLERLHRTGGFRMLRHCSKEKEKELSVIEREYLAAGAGDTFHTRVAERAGTALRWHDAVYEFHSLAAVCLPRARDAAAVLAAARIEDAQATRAVEADYSAALAQSERNLVDVSARAERDERETVEAADSVIAAARRDLARVHREIASATSSRDHAVAAFTRRVGQPPTRTRVDMSTLSWLRDALLPSWLVNSATLRDRYSLAVDSLERLGQEERELMDRIAATEQSQSVARNRRSERVNAARSARDTVVEVAQNLRAERLAALSLRFAATETETRDTQAAAGRYAAGLGDDATPIAWQMALDAVGPQLSAARARGDFVADWIRDISAEPKGLLDYYWGNVQVFFSTCVGLASWRQLVERGRDAVDLVIIDEAAHATAGETVVPLAYARRVILIGDEMQLPPVLKQEVACGEDCSVLFREVPDEPGRERLVGAAGMEKCWLKCSLFEWLWRTKPDLPRVMLNTQFRMHPDIADFVGSVFYPEGLINGIGAAERELGFGEFTRPVVLIPTSAYPDRHEERIEKGDGTGNSYRNRLEARILQRVIEKAEAELREPQEFGIITPYAPQVQLIRDTLKPLLAGLRKVRLSADDVASVDSFQGSERDVILVSFVRSPERCPGCGGTGAKKRGESCPRCGGKGWEGSGLTFVRDLRRLNVAFSRARKMLVLVGDVDALTDTKYRGGAPGGEVLRLFREHCADRGKVLHLWERSDESD